MVFKIRSSNEMRNENLKRKINSCDVDLEARFKLRNSNGIRQLSG